MTVSTPGYRLSSTPVAQPPVRSPLLLPPAHQLLNKLQPLFSSSKLFRDPNKADDQGNKKSGKYGRRNKGRGRDDKVKMGQGGTLDPLADGVLGASLSPRFETWEAGLVLTSSSDAHSGGHQRGDEIALALPRLHERVPRDRTLWLHDRQLRLGRQVGPQSRVGKHHARKSRERARPVPRRD